MLDPKTRKALLASQRNEITEHIIYGRLARRQKNPHNRKLLEGMSKDEQSHYDFWKKHTGKDVTPSRLKVLKYYWISVLFGLTFGLKLMENGEEMAQGTYEKIAKAIPEAKKIVQDENRHESELVSMINEEKLKYVGSIVLGLNDALVEFTGALAGFTLALQNTRLIGTTGLIMGFAAALSMAASEYLSTKTEQAPEGRRPTEGRRQETPSGAESPSVKQSEGSGKNPFRAALYTGSVYMLTVFLLISPFMFFESMYLSLGITLAFAVAVIFIFTFYTSVAQDLPFKRRFAEMAAISLGVASISFLIGFLVRIFLGVQI
jgi:VIT1/CCC1 family predicted Fe2+/Mn2+ transporter